jgi:hypothetical protein
MILDLFPKAHSLMSTQPLPFDFIEMFGPGEELPPPLGKGIDSDLRMAQLEEKNVALEKLFDSRLGTTCGQWAWEDGRKYFMAGSAFELEKLAGRRTSPDRHVGYVNAGRLFPNSFEERKRWFIDPVHLNDEGMDRVSSAYATYILEKDGITCEKETPPGT